MCLIVPLITETIIQKRWEEQMVESMDRWIFHVDLDAFFASVEQFRNHLELIGFPVCVGHDPKGGHGRGVVRAVSYEARDYGVYTGMPVSKAYRLCPDAIFIPGQFSDYLEASEEFMDVLEEYADGGRVRRASIDEAYIEVTECVQGQSEAYALARTVQRSVKDETQLPCSIGVASNISLAKVATSQNKPMGITLVPQSAEEAAEFLAPLGVEELHGVGKKTGERLRAQGIEYLWQIQQMTLAELWPIMGKSSVWLRNRALGIDDRPLLDSGPRARKSISKRRTFMEDIDPDARDFLTDSLQMICDRITEKLTLKGYSYKTVGLTLRYDDFETIQRSRSLPIATNSTEMLTDTALRLLEKHLDQRRMVRQLGVTISNLTKDDKQCTLVQFL